jgi:hypothetical protein
VPEVWSELTGSTEKRAGNSGPSNERDPVERHVRPRDCPFFKFQRGKAEVLQSASNSYRAGVAVS